jgi:hypothetical protein
MGQKVNPLVFRTGSKNKLWDSQYVSNNIEESSYYLFQDLEIRKYIDTLFESYGMIVHKCIIKRSNTKLNIFINFYITSKIPYKYFHFFSNISNLKSRIIKEHGRPKKFFNLLFIKNKLKKQISRDKNFNKNKLNYSKLKLKLFETLLHFSSVILKNRNKNETS